MLEFLSSNLFWWHWIILGILLLTMEIFTGTFILLGLGLSGIIVGIIDVIYPLSLNMELTVWMISSLLSIVLWFRYMKDNSVEHSGQSNYSLETLGVVEQNITATRRGKVRFDTPVLGTSIWTATSKETLEANTRVEIIEIKGQLIEVAKI
jgi:membrane protein implicated in regulation of membrane protease activity